MSAMDSNVEPPMSSPLLISATFASPWEARAFSTGVNRAAAFTNRPWKSL